MNVHVSFSDFLDDIIIGTQHVFVPKVPNINVELRKFYKDGGTKAKTFLQYYVNKIFRSGVDSSMPKLGAFWRIVCEYADGSKPDDDLIHKQVIELYTQGVMMYKLKPDMSDEVTLKCNANIASVTPYLSYRQLSGDGFKSDSDMNVEPFNIFSVIDQAVVRDLILKFTDVCSVNGGPYHLGKVPSDIKPEHIKDRITNCFIAHLCNMANVVAKGKDFSSEIAKSILSTPIIIGPALYDTMLSMVSHNYGYKCLTFPTDVSMKSAFAHVSGNLNSRMINFNEEKTLSGINMALDYNAEIVNAGASESSQGLVKVSSMTLRKVVQRAPRDVFEYVPIDVINSAGKAAKKFIIIDRSIVDKDEPIKHFSPKDHGVTQLQVPLSFIDKVFSLITLAMTKTNIKTFSAMHNYVLKECPVHVPDTSRLKSLTSELLQQWIKFDIGDKILVWNKRHYVAHVLS